ncbi:MAG: MFS transporter [Deltaproteobacteria bacterium]|nr:MFS transporter [Deltaproteobacteria bacterium]
MKRKIFYGWWVVVALFFVGMLGPMARYTITAFGPFISEELGWGATSIGLALSLSLWVYAIASIPVGWLIDRIGSRRILILGAILLFFGLWWFSTVRVLWQLYLSVGLIVGIGVSMTHFLATQSTARKWFTKKAGLAGGILTSAFWIGSGTLSPLLTGMGNAMGWREACFTYGLGICIIIVLLAWLVIRDTPESMGLLPDGDSAAGGPGRADNITEEISWNSSEALKTRSFWMIIIGYALVGIPGQGLLGHLILWGVQLGWPKATAGVFLSAFTLTLSLTAIPGGWLADRFGKRQVLMISYGLSTILSLVCWLFVQSAGSLMILMAVFGTVYGISAGPGLWSAYVGDVFGRESIGRLFGIMTLGYGLIGGSGPLLWGWVYDVTGQYNLACLLSALCFVLVILCLVFAKPILKGTESLVSQGNYHHEEHEVHEGKNGIKRFVL